MTATSLSIRMMTHPPNQWCITNIISKHFVPQRFCLNAFDQDDFARRKAMIDSLYLSLSLYYICAMLLVRYFFFRHHPRLYVGITRVATISRRRDIHRQIRGAKDCLGRTSHPGDMSAIERPHPKNRESDPSLDSAAHLRSGGDSASGSGQSDPSVERGHRWQNWWVW